MPRRVLLFGDNTYDIPLDPFRRYQQVIFTKRNRDFFANPKADRLVNALSAHHLVVFGVVTEFCIKTAALGLMARQHRVVVVSDACGHWTPNDADLALRQMDAKGAILVTSDELISGAADERIRACQPAPIADVEEPQLELLLPDRNGRKSHSGNGRGEIDRLPAGAVRPARPQSPADSIPEGIDVSAVSARRSRPGLPTKAPKTRPDLA